jgi:NAD(P)-dependent dehydrogenase (short-subunit alcohol dehydrogenase family)
VKITVAKQVRCIWPLDIYIAPAFNTSCCSQCPNTAPRLPLFIMAAIFSILTQKFNPPKPSTESFAGKTVLITGATTGLGLEAAKKFAALNASKVIITCREASRGQNAKKQIEAWMKDSASGKKASSTEVHVMSLDMSNFDSVRAFAEEVNSKFSRIDVAILNAGTHQVKWIQSVEGWEEDFQVNTISTTLLGLLLLPTLLKSAGGVGGPPHLTFVSSGLALKAKPASFQKYYESPNALKAMSSQDEYPGSQLQYGISKLLLEYSMRHIAQLPALQSDDGQPKVIVNSTCPGLCKSDLGRDMMTNVLIRILAWVMFAVIARTAEQGSNAYVSSVTRDGSSQGQIWKDDSYYDPGRMIESDEGKKFGEKIWKEMMEVLGDADPKVKTLLARN